MTTVVEDKLKQWKQIEGEIQSIYLLKQQTLSQFNENTLVKGELDLLTEETAVYKLIGPVLITVELDSAKENVGKRLEFIEAEIQKLDRQIAAKQGEQTTLGDEIAKMQQAMAAEAAEATRAVAKEVVGKAGGR